jgi:IS30 family transposase
MTRKGKKNLTYVQRLKLECYLKTDLTKKEIAEKLGVCLATVYNELKRGNYNRKQYSWTDCYGETRYKYVNGYSPEIAEEKYRLNMTSKGAPLKIGNDYAFVNYVEKRIIEDKLSPCAVLGEIKRYHLFDTDISKTTLYRYISSGLFLHLTMRDLPTSGKRKKHYRKAVMKRPPRGESIEKRPKEILERNTFGHWEMDCVVGRKQSKDTLLVLTERLTRYEIIMKMPNRKAQTVVDFVDKLERRYSETDFRRIFKSITVDNGVEFSDFQGLERSVYGGKRTSVYYCHPYTSCERGSNERVNRDIRRQLPKGTDFTTYSDKTIQRVADWVNAYPREIFNFATAAEMFAQQLAAL